MGFGQTRIELQRFFRRLARLDVPSFRWTELPEKIVGSSGRRIGFGKSWIQSNRLLVVLDALQITRFRNFAPPDLAAFEKSSVSLGMNLARPGQSSRFL